MCSVSIDGSLWFTSRAPQAAWEVNERGHTGVTVFGVSLCRVMSLESTTWGSHREALGSLPRGVGRGS
jgi:hypothetical protein